MEEVEVEETLDATDTADDDDSDEESAAKPAPAAAEEDESSAAFVIRDDDEDDAPAQQVVTAGATADPVKGLPRSRSARSPCSMREQEVELAKRIEAGLFAEEKLNAGEKIDMTLKRELWWISQDGKKAKNHLPRPTFVWLFRWPSVTPAAACSSST